MSHGGAICPNCGERAEDVDKINAKGDEVHRRECLCGWASSWQLNL